MYILNQDSTNLYNLDHFSDIRVIFGSEKVGIALDTTVVGAFKDSSIAEKVYKDILDWISNPTEDGIRNIFYIPEEN